jgi:hypothetical protein
MRVNEQYELRQKTIVWLWTGNEVADCEKPAARAAKKNVTSLL